MILKRCREGRPGEICRGAVRWTLGPDPVKELSGLLRQAKVDLVNEQDSGMINARRRRIYRCAIYLLAYGSLEGFEDVLDHAASPQVLHARGGWELMWFLPCLMPLPDELGAEEVWDGIKSERGWIIDNIEKIRQWYRDNRDRLVWDAEQDRYVLRED